MSDVGRHPGDAARRQAIARAVLDARRSAPAGTLPPRGAPADAPTRLSATQERLRFLHESAPDATAYNIPTAFEIVGPLDVDALERATNRAVNRHDALRARFVLDHGVPVALVLPEVRVPFARSELPPGDAARRDVLSRAARHRFVLDRAPPIAAWLWRASAERHVFLLNVHHIALEAWSLRLLLAEIGDEYVRETGGAPTPSSGTATSFWDYVAWDRGRRSEESDERLVTRALARLGDDPVHPAFESAGRDGEPADRNGGMRGRRLAADLPAAVAALATQHECTPFNVLLAAFEVFVHRHTGVGDFLVGTPVGTRSHPATTHAVGLYLDTLLLRATARPEQPFERLLADVRTDLLAALDTADVPFEGVAQRLSGADRRTGHAPFDVMFTMQTAGVPALPMGAAVSARRLPYTEVHNGGAKAALSLIVEPDGGAWDLWAEYDAGLFPERTIDAMLVRFEELLRGAVRMPGAPVAQLPLLPAAERTLLLEGFNDTGDGSVRSLPAPALVRARMDSASSSVAIVSPSGELTYGALARAAGSIAALIRARGAGRGDLVAICSRRTPAYCAAVLGVEFASCAYLPLDPDTPDARLAFCVADSGAALVLTDSPARFSASDTPVVALPDVHADVAVQDGLPAHLATALDDLAYVIYTSGSTGTPKGVQIEHRGLANLVAWHLASYPVGPGERVSSIAGLGFDASVWEFWPALAAGATLVLPPDEVRLDPAALGAWLVSERIAIAFLPTPLAEALLDTGFEGAPSFRLLLVGGDTLRARPWPPRPFRIVNHYGPTENTVVATAADVPVGWTAHRAPPIGTPILNTRAYVLDGVGSLVPVGAPGELYLAGPALARGYVGRDTETALRFVANPYGGGAFARMYRTGDVVRWDWDGTLHFLGRADSQVKIRGNRVELGEIESALQQSPTVGRAVVVPVPSASNATGLVAFVEPRAGARPDLALLRRALRASLPPYMVPDPLIVVKEIPVTSNGKLDRVALEQRARDARNLRAERGEPPKSPEERLVARVWSEFLAGASQPTRFDRFTQLGGHSLLALRVVDALERETGTRISPMHLLMDDLATIAAMLRPPASPLPPRPDAPDQSQRPSALGRTLRRLLGGGR